jgi:1H-pyrrole-2-carbonyl-[peptidyl-carrier protein] brominase
MISSNSEYFDVVVIGCGPGGSVLASSLARAGLSVLALERHTFPRYHIGESLTGIVSDFIKDFDLTEEMAQYQFPPKLGVKVIGRAAKQEFFVPVLQPTWQVRRGEFDDLFLKKAISHGVTHRYGSVKQVFTEGKKVVGVGYKPENSQSDLLKHVKCKVVADASGHSALLSTLKIAGPRKIDSFWRQIAVFSQYKNVIRDPGELGDSTFIFYSEVNHWAWFIPLSPDLVSIGVVAPIPTFKKQGDSPEDYLRWGLDNINPDLSRRMKNAEMTEPIRVIRNYSYRIEPFAGDGWICIGDAHRFTDPIFSFGLALTMQEARAASTAIQEAIATDSCKEPFDKYVAFSNVGQDIAYDFIKYFWKFPTFFAYQINSSMRKDIIFLLGGDIFPPRQLKAIEAMRKSLQTGDNATLTDEFKELGDSKQAAYAREIAFRIASRFALIPEVLAAYIEINEDGLIQVSLVLESDLIQNEDIGLGVFEEELYSEYGWRNLTFIYYRPSQITPDFSQSSQIFNKTLSKAAK